MSGITIPVCNDITHMTNVQQGLWHGYWEQYATEKNFLRPIDAKPVHCHAASAADRYVSGTAYLAAYQRGRDARRREKYWSKGAPASRATAKKVINGWMPEPPPAFKGRRRKTGSSTVTKSTAPTLTIIQDMDTL